MRIVKNILLLLLIFTGVILIAALFIDSDIKVQESADIDASVEKVWDHVNTIAALNSWNAWFEKDKMMRTTVAGNPGYPGSQFCWDSDSTSVGSGCLRLARLTTQRYVELDIVLYIPRETHAKTYIKLQPLGTTTRVTINFNLSLPYPSRILKLFRSDKKVMSEHYALGLQKLKQLAEAP